MTRAQIPNEKVNAIQETLEILDFTFEQIEGGDFWTLIETDATEDQLDQILNEIQ